MSETQEAIQYIQDRTEWNLEDICILDDSRGEWTARATTTHNTARGQSEMSFLVIGHYQQYTTLALSSIPMLVTWASQQERKELAKG